MTFGELTVDDLREINRVNHERNRMLCRGLPSQDHFFHPDVEPSWCSVIVFLPNWGKDYIIVIILTICKCIIQGYQIYSLYCRTITLCQIPYSLNNNFPSPPPTLFFHLNEFAYSTYLLYLKSDNICLLVYDSFHLP